MSNPQGIFALCPTTLAPRPLPWGSPEFIGLGFLSLISILLTELFGSPFLKSISIIVGLAVGCIVAGAAGYIDGSSIKSAPAITFLWYPVLCNTVCDLSIDLTCFQGSHLQDRGIPTSHSSESAPIVHYPLNSVLIYLSPFHIIVFAAYGITICIYRIDLLLIHLPDQLLSPWKPLEISRRRQRCLGWKLMVSSLIPGFKVVYWYV
jgi:hypothetical protein